MPERTPNRLASYEAAQTTERLPLQATTTGVAHSSVLTPARRANSEECMGWVVETLELTRISSGVEPFQGQAIFYYDGRLRSPTPRGNSSIRIVALLPAESRAVPESSQSDETALRTDHAESPRHNA